MCDAMIDLESMGTETNPCLLQISAVKFDINTGEINGTFDTKVDLQSCLDAGLSVTAGSIAFWMKNDSVTQEARDSVMKETYDDGTSGKTLASALMSFSLWCELEGVEYVHGNGAASDNVWLRSAYKAVGLACPFDFRADVCFRSFKTLAKRMGWKDNVENFGVYHDGVDDAIYQVSVLRSVLSFLIGDRKVYE